MEFLIRPARAEDAPRLSGLAFAAKASWGYPGEWLEQWRHDLTLTPEYLDTHRAWVAEWDGAILGVCVLALQGHHASIEHLWIAPDQQRQGIGRALVRVALEMAAQCDAQRVEVESDPFAEAFYAGLGARRIGALPAPMPGAPERSLPVLEFTISRRT
jgi:ribosomal protein S18 acetylase RimI-like enzyme